MLRRRNLDTRDHVMYVTCNTGIEEDIDHLFFSCHFARRCCSSINFNWDESLSLPDRFAFAKTQHNMPFFMKIALLASWELWKLRNAECSTREELVLAFGLQISRTVAFSIRSISKRTLCLLSALDAISKFFHVSITSFVYN